MTISKMTNDLNTLIKNLLYRFYNAVAKKKNRPIASHGIIFLKNPFNRGLYSVLIYKWASLYFF
jgi:hypothetical protein